MILNWSKAENCLSIVHSATKRLNILYKQDRDGDGVQDNQDNCPLVINSSQLDTDNDGIGKQIRENFKSYTNQFFYNL